MFDTKQWFYKNDSDLPDGRLIYQGRPFMGHNLKLIQKAEQFINLTSINQLLTKY